MKRIDFDNRVYGTGTAIVKRINELYLDYIIKQRKAEVEDKKRNDAAEEK